MTTRSEGDEEVCREVYARIAGFFQSFRQQTVQIELLPFYPVPPTHIFTESTSLGIPKSSLWKAFRHARPLFFTTLSSLNSPTSQTAQPTSTSTYLTLLSTSTILLLHDSEHLTAINARKRVLITHFPPNAPFPIGNRGQELPFSPQSEYFFITSLLTSPLHKHTKSPHLWSHRRWLISTYPSLKHPIPPPSPGAPSSRPGTADNSVLAKSFRRWCRKEVSTVLRAAEAHPKNYYAWTYARWLVGVQGVGFNHEDVVSWCMKHPGDVSGWSFLAWLWIEEARHNNYNNSGGNNNNSGGGGGGSSYQQQLRDGNTAGIGLGGTTRSVSDVRYNQLFSVLKYSHNTAPGHEALWGFVRAVVGGGVFDDGYRTAIVELLKGWDGEAESIRAVEDVVRERMLLRATVGGLEGRYAAGVNVDSEMVDMPG
ncbi:hypothetical protein TWF730_001912 [Orbilia blumenaviensis]|uniref:Uncharacterized protein n=1 Tax=Orbilia blumenaviensis TaxID=1796055 RepID=A0AAV9UDD8_9PEZI